MHYEFGKLRSPDLEEVLKKKPLAILPVGQVEVHGAHLPINTDCVIASKVAAAAAERLGERLSVLLMDPISYGYSGRIMTRWPGTMQVGMDTIRDYVYDVCASLADMGVEKIAIFSSHGQHMALFELVARKLADEKNVAPVVLMPIALVGETFERIAKGGKGSSCHSGEIETSLMLYLAPDSVDMAKADDNPVKDVGLPPSGVFWSTWQRQTTQSSVYGTPSAASAESGKVLFEAMVTEAVNFLDRYYRHASGVGS